ncbi:MAG: hypothetical protein ACKODX_18540 [Gemmata sp.]
MRTIQSVPPRPLTCSPSARAGWSRPRAGRTAPPGDSDVCAAATGLLRFVRRAPCGTK